VSHGTALGLVSAPVPPHAHADAIGAALSQPWAVEGCDQAGARRGYSRGQLRRRRVDRLSATQVWLDRRHRA
jgi:hypothetical protein